MKIRLQISRVTVFALLFALCPFLMNYKIPFTEINFTVGVFMLVFVVEFVIAIMKPLKFKWEGFYPKKLFWITVAFIVFNHFNVLYRSHPPNYSMSALIDMLLLIIELSGIILFFSDKNAIDIFRKYTENIAFIMAIIIFFECISWYMFKIYPGGGNHQLLLPFLELNDYDNLSAIISPTGLFRPSAFFLEPAHFSNYCIVALVSLLFPDVDKPLNIKTVVITISLFFTLSGFGIMLAVLVWSIYLIIGSGRVGGKNVGRNLLILIGASMLVFTIFIISPSFRSAVSRFTGSEGDNGIYGRMGNYYLFIQKLQGFSRIWGMGYKNLPLRGTTNITQYFTGILDLMYCQGIVGTVIFSALYVLMMLKTYKDKNMLAFVITTISLVFVIGSSYFSASSILIYIPFVFAIDYNRKRNEEIGKYSGNEID